jgi:hypothetical protein
MIMTIDYFERRQAESLHFFYATQVDANKAVRSIFWVEPLRNTTSTYFILSVAEINKNYTEFHE